MTSTSEYYKDKVAVVTGAASGNRVGPRGNDALLRAKWSSSPTHQRRVACALVVSFNEYQDFDSKTPNISKYYRSGAAENFACEDWRRKCTNNT